MPKILNIRIVYVCISLCYCNNSALYAQLDFILKEDAVKGYELIEQKKSFWPINSDSISDAAIKQKWQDSEKGEYYVFYNEFENSSLARQGTEFIANSCAVPYIEGSPTGGVYGEKSWVAVDSSAVCFHLRQYSIMIFKPINFQHNDKKRLKFFSENITKQIKSLSDLE